jgi:hypothetical protein
MAEEYYKICDTCSFLEDYDIFQSEPLKQLKCRLFKFKQDGKCFCYCLDDMYYWVFQTYELEYEEGTVNPRNPKSGQVLLQIVISRLENEYNEFVMKLKSKKLPSKTKKGIPEKFKELKQQLDAINPTNYLTSSVMYLEELEEILDDDDYMKNKKLVEEFLKLMKI